MEPCLENGTAKFIDEEFVTKNKYIVTKQGEAFEYPNMTKRNVYDNGYGYDIIAFYISERKMTLPFYLHRIVAKAFIPNPCNLPQVNHKNGDRKDNRVENLEWISPSDNIKHGIKAGKINRKGRDYAGYMDEDDYKLIAKLLCTSLSIREIAENIGRPRGTVSSAVNGRAGKKKLIKAIQRKSCLSENCRCKETLNKLENIDT